MTQTQNPFLTPAFDTEEDPFPTPNTNLTGDKRTEARLCAVQAIAQCLLSEEDLGAVSKDFLTQQIKPRTADKKIFTAVTATAVAETERFIPILSAEFPTEKSKTRTWESANPVHQALLLAAMSEWHSTLTTPPKTVLNEYLNISKGFCTPEETAFINGVLNTVMQKLMLV